MNQKVLDFGTWKEWMSNVRQNKVMRSTVSRGKLRGVKVAMNARGMTVEAARQCAQDRVERACKELNDGTAILT